MCDDGNRDSGDGCWADCRGEEVCGDGLLDADEACDDGNDAQTAAAIARDPLARRFGGIDDNMAAIAFAPSMGFGIAKKRRSGRSFLVPATFALQTCYRTACWVQSASLPRKSLVVSHATAGVTCAGSCAPIGKAE